MEESKNKFHALQLFTDTFAAETVHLTNEQVGIYIRLLCFAWTKNAKPFTTESARIICQCRTAECEYIVDDILREFFVFNKEEYNWTHKRLTAEHEYLSAKYKKRSESGRKGGLARSKNQAPIPIPNPIPKVYTSEFEWFWNQLSFKRGSKYKAFLTYKKIGKKNLPPFKDMIMIYEEQIKDVDVQFVPHFSTWLSQRRWENDEKQQIPDLVKRLQDLGYEHYARDGNIEKFMKDGKYYKVDVYDEKHQIVLDNEKEKSEIQAH